MWTEFHSMKIIATLGESRPPKSSLSFTLCIQHPVSSQRMEATTLWWTRMLVLRWGWGNLSDRRMTEREKDEQ